MDIRYYNTHIDGMRKSMEDKMFFTKYLSPQDIDHFVDFGCANGEMLARIGEVFPEWELTGVDNNPKMIKIAQEKCPQARFTDGITCLAPSNNSLLNLSSVIHEVYSYSNATQIKSFWFDVFKSGKWKYISIREFMVSEKTDRESHIQDYNNVFDKSHPSILHSFIERWGNVSNQKTLIHYLLKYRYIANWEREVDENYLPITLEQLLNLIPDNYEIIYMDHYILPFTKNKIYEDFEIELTDPTHIKLLLRRKD